MRHDARRIVDILAVLALVLPTFAFADCNPQGIGPPGVSTLIPTANSLAITWVDLCPVKPLSMDIRNNGTQAKNWQDGTLLGQAAQNPAQPGGIVTASNLPPSTQYTNLHLCGIYPPPTPPQCTAAGGETTPAAGLYPVVTITVGARTEGSIDLSWNGHVMYDYYLLRFISIPDTEKNVAEVQLKDPKGGTTGEWNFTKLMSGTMYRFKVKGCYGLNYCDDDWAVVEASTSPPPPPVRGPPVDLQIFSNSVQWINGQWVNPQGAHDVQVYRDPALPPTVAANAFGLTSFHDTYIVAGQPYTYRVCEHYINPDELFCATGSGVSQIPPPAPMGCRGESLVYATVEVLCYQNTVVNGQSVTAYDAKDPMVLERLDGSNWVQADDGKSNPWDVPPPRNAVPYFQDNSFQSVSAPPKTATYRVIAVNTWANTPSPSFTVTLDLTVQPVSPPGRPLCGPRSVPYRPCLKVATPP
jgi:hypothetical protein